MADDVICFLLNDGQCFPKIEMLIHSDVSGLVY